MVASALCVCRVFAILARSGGPARPERYGRARPTYSRSHALPRAYDELWPAIEVRARDLNRIEARLGR
eukprot:scaffold11251_cov112-Isochrysis_galbana.AAC.2